MPNDKSTTVESLGLKDGSVIQIKDLGTILRNLLPSACCIANGFAGPQISWRTVFVIEYLGPLLIHPAMYFLQTYIYQNPPSEPSTLQMLSCLTISLHFLKREVETLFVHRFSNATMPAFNIFKNSAHYWLLSGLLIAYFTYSPTSLTAGPANPAITYPALAVFAIAELCNLNAHLVLRSLRSPGGTERGVPRGLGFDWVTCPNYLFEIIAWISILAINQSWTTAVFIAVGGAQMAAWAKKKEIRYRKESAGRYNKKRYTMIPGIW